MAEFQDKAAFYAGLRKVTGPLDQVQVDTIERILASAAHWPIGFLAYGLATAWHEARLRPIAEIGKGQGRPYGKPGKHGQAQYGRGLVQLTWDRNYEWADALAHAHGLTGPGEVLADFDLVLRPDIAALVLVKGMERGGFTGKKLGDYMVDRGNHAAFVRARRIINGTDRAELIAGYADTIQQACDEGVWK